MSFLEAFVWTLLRSLAAGLLAVPLSSVLVRCVNQSSGRCRFWMMCFVLSPLLTPELVIGYAYRSFGLSLLHHPNINHCVYTLLVILKFVPAGAVVRLCLPASPVSEDAIHCARLLRDGAVLESQLRRMKAVGSLPIFSIVFLLVFQEFDMGSLMQIPSWTVSLFDSQAGGLSPVESARRMILPVVVQLLIMLPLLGCVFRRKQNPGRSASLTRLVSHRSNWTGILLTSVALLLLFVLPFSLIAVSGFNDLQGVVGNTMLVRSTMLELTVSILIAGPCAVLAMLIARSAMPKAASVRPRKAIWKQGLLTILFLPGLFGSLVVSLAVLSVIHQTALTGLKATVFPMSAALILFLLPRAILLTAFVETISGSTGSHLSRLLSRSSESRIRSHADRLIWWYEYRPVFWSGALLFYWALSNLTAAALLCPPSVSLFGSTGNIVPLPVRLYRFMHHGRTGSLSLMTLASIAFPLLLVIGMSRVLPMICRLASRSSDYPESARGSDGPRAIS